ncbi:MAG: CpsD/CapB family tyrosine-protein kinase [bacterium]
MSDILQIVTPSTASAVFSPSRKDGNGKSSTATSLRTMRLGELLLRMGVISNDGLARIEAAQKNSSKPFGEIARNLGLASKKDIRDALSIQYGADFKRKGQLRVPRLLHTLKAPLCHDAEQYRLACTNLLMNKRSPASKLLAVSGVGKKVDSAGACVNLGLAFTQLGRKTLIIDCDFREGRVHEIFSRRPKSGLAGILREGISPTEAQINTSVRNLSAIPNGDGQYGAQHLLASEEFSRLVMTSMDDYDTVLLNAGNTLRLSDSLLVWALAKSAVFIAQRNKTRSPQLKQAMDGLKNCEAQLAGTILLG